MTFGKSIATCLSKYATFTGRASRSEFWWFFLFGILLSAGAGIADEARDIEAFAPLINLALLLPRLAAGARRLHDIGKSGWWQLLILTIIGIIPLVFWWVREGAGEENEYGPATRADA